MPSDAPKPAEPEFDADLLPSNPVNQEAAEARGLQYDNRVCAYRDSDGCIIRDSFGQPL